MCPLLTACTGEMPWGIGVPWVTPLLATGVGTGGTGTGAGADSGVEVQGVGFSEGWVLIPVVGAGCAVLPPPPHPPPPPPL